MVTSVVWNQILLVLCISDCHALCDRSTVISNIFHILGFKVESDTDRGPSSTRHNMNGVYLLTSCDLCSWNIGNNTAGRLWWIYMVLKSRNIIIND